MKKAILFLVLLSTIGISHAQIDSVYYYNPDGSKNWWHIQKDVVTFRLANNEEFVLPTNINIVDLQEYWDMATRKFNELCLTYSITPQQVFDLQNEVLSYPDFDVFSLALTKEPTQPYAAQKYYRTDDQILVTFHDPLIEQITIDNFMAEYSLQLIHAPSSGLPNTIPWTYVFKILPNGDRFNNTVTIARKIIENDSDLVKIAEPNVYSGDMLSCQPVSEMSLAPGGTKSTWHISNDGGVVWNGQNGGVDADADICECWGEGYNGAGIKMGLIDVGGFDYDHPDVKPFLTGFDLTSTTTPMTSFNSNYYTNANVGHGMTVAGIMTAIPNNTALGARYAAGVAYGADVTPLLLNLINDVDVTKGLQKAWEENIDVLNMSFRMAYSASVALQIDNLLATGRPSPNASGGYFGTIVVAASGNDDLVGFHFPANHPGVIGVGMSDPEDYRCSYIPQGQFWPLNPGDGSTYGPPEYGYDVVAPGTLMMTTDLKSSNGFGSGDYHLGLGTSYSSPLVASIAAILLEKNPNLSYTQVTDLIRNGAEQVHPSVYDYNMYPSAPGYNNEMFYGRVSCINSLNNTPLSLNESAAPLSLTAIRQSTDEYTIYIPDGSGNQSFSLFDMTGRQLSLKNVSPHTTQIQVDLSNLAAGMYVFVLNTGDGRTGTAKLLK